MQGTASDIIKRAMIDLDAWLEAERVPAHMLIAGARRAGVQVRADRVEAVGAKVRELMQGAPTWPYRWSSTSGSRQLGRGA